MVIFAKLFKNISKLLVTSNGGRPEFAIYRRIVRSLTTGKVIDDCVIDDVSDPVFRRTIPKPENLRVDLIMRGALSMYQRKGALLSALHRAGGGDSAIRRHGTYGGMEL